MSTMNPDPVIHHVEMCVQNLKKAVDAVKKYGFRPYLKRTVPGFCEQIVMKLNKIFFVITEKNPNFKITEQSKGSLRSEPLTVLCPNCENEISHEAHVDTVFNISLQVKDVEACVSRIINKESGALIKTPTTIEDSHGYVTYAIVKSVCSNVIHTLLNTDHYSGTFLPGYSGGVDYGEDAAEINKEITHIDHVTLAIDSGKSESLINFYESCFGMKRVIISNSEDEEEEGLILREGVGLRLKAMEYWMCSETGLTCPSSRSPNSMMLVIVESLPGQTNCNVETFLREHRGPGVEHIALSSRSITQSVKIMKQLMVKFRNPPATYYKHLRETPEIKEIDDLNLNQLEKLGILIDREIDPEDDENKKPKYLMQIFALPIFDRKTFFIEIIQRSGAKFFGAGNILALVRSIREEEMRKAVEEDRKKIANESIPSIRTC